MFWRIGFISKQIYGCLFTMKSGKDDIRVMLNDVIYIYVFFMTWVLRFHCVIRKSTFFTQIHLTQYLCLLFNSSAPPWRSFSFIFCLCLAERFSNAHQHPVISGNHLGIFYPPLFHIMLILPKLNWRAPFGFSINLQNSILLFI